MVPLHYLGGKPTRWLNHERPILWRVLPTLYPDSHVFPMWVLLVIVTWVVARPNSIISIGERHAHWVIWWRVQMALFQCWSTRSLNHLVARTNSIISIGGRYRDKLSCSLIALTMPIGSSGIRYFFQRSRFIGIAETFGPTLVVIDHLTFKFQLLVG